MRVLHLVKTTSGAAWALRQIAVLCRAGVDVTVALPSATAGLAPRYAAAGATVVAADLDFTARAPWRLAGAVARCRALVAAVVPDLIHSHFVSTTVVARLALGRHHPIPRVFQVPGPLHLEHRLFRALDLATAGPRDVWLGSCRWTCAAYRRAGVPADRIALAYYGTDLRTLAAPRGRFRAALGLDRTTPLIGMVAYMYPPKRFLGHRRGVKGHEDLIDAYPMLAGRNPGLVLVMAGGPWAGGERYARALAARARRTGGDAIRLLGTRDDVASLYADLDVAVHPSLSENCGGALESLAAGCPTVATAVGGLPDVVLDGVTGWLVPPRDPARLAAAIAAALDDPVEARLRGAIGRAHVQRLFAIEKTGRAMAALYGRVPAGEPATDPRPRALRRGDAGAATSRPAESVPAFAGSAACGATVPAAAGKERAA